VSMRVCVDSVTFCLLTVELSVRFPLYSVLLSNAFLVHFVFPFFEGGRENLLNFCIPP